MEGSFERTSLKGSIKNRLSSIGGQMAMGPVRGGQVRCVCRGGMRLEIKKIIDMQK